MAVKASDLKCILEKQSYQCFYTDIKLEPHHASADHLVAYSRGGSNRPDNIAIVCRVVNRAKGVMSHSEFIGMCRMVCDVHSAGVDDEKAFIEFARQNGARD